jgi:hypothetical protein
MCILRCTVFSARMWGLCTIAAALMVLGSVSARAQTASGHWTVSAVDGTATITSHGGEGFAVRRGQPVGASTTIATDEDTTVVLTRRGDSITVYPNSRMTVPASTGAEELGILQSVGTLLFRMETRESRDFEVNTPYLAATIKGTTFTVVVEQSRATVSVTEGMVLVAPVYGGRSEMVHPGWTATVRTGRDSVQLTERNLSRKSRTGGVVESDGTVSDSSNSDSSGSDNSRSDRSNSDNSGSDNSRSDRSNSDDTGSDNAGQGKSNSDNNGSDGKKSDASGAGDPADPASGKLLFGGGNVDKG